MAQVDGKTVNIGDVVYFKCDVEQGGYITAISGSRLTLATSNENGFRGDYIGGNTKHVVDSYECWLEG